ncbi:hypothetical protein DERP_011042 [Dermatophagoides pteronyssinus]|uniref:Secreted protein n=1 Tax=Dermatophagoides pteronyssinus TaxID=6956 RepID=A0ABQ8JVA2_DERPT|nr:hypothetical protein DERP_011042 [Dermatophagoides pteronyssinus]
MNIVIMAKFLPICKPFLYILASISNSISCGPSNDDIIAKRTSLSAVRRISKSFRLAERTPGRGDFTDTKQRKKERNQLQDRFVCSKHSSTSVQCLPVPSGSRKPVRQRQRYEPIVFSHTETCGEQIPVCEYSLHSSISTQIFLQTYDPYVLIHCSSRRQAVSTVHSSISIHFNKESLNINPLSQSICLQ